MVEIKTIKIKTRRQAILKAIYFTLKLSLLFCSLLGIQGVAVVHAQSNVEIPVQEDQVNREPWDSYQKIVAFEKLHQQKSFAVNQKKRTKPNSSNKFSLSDNVKNLSKLTDLSLNTYLLLLLRKAQSENLLYFHKDLLVTVNQAQKLINIQTPNYISSQFNVYAGIIAQRKGLYEQSVNLLSKAIDQASKAELPRVYIMAKGELAYTRSLKELYETSLVEIQKAYVDAFELDDQFLVATINETYGAIYGYLKEYSKSIEYYEKALESYEQLGYKAHVAEAIYGMASTYRYWKKYDLAIAKFELYVEKVSYTPNTDIAFFGNYGLGMSFAEKGDCQHALSIIDKALALNGQIDYNAELYKRKASCLIKLNKLAQAQQSINAATNIFNKLPELKGTNWQLEVEKISAMLANARGSYKKAFALLVEYQQKYVQLQEKIASDRLIKVRSALEIERRDVEISLLQQRAKVQSLQMEKKQQQVNLQRYLIIVVIIFVLAGLVFLIAQKRNMRKLYQISIRDSLSDLFNRKYVFSILDEKLASAKNNGDELSILLLDIDDFKFVNDQFGHPFGDEVIKQIAVICKELFRPEYITGRIGGEEFLCVLPKIDDNECKKLAQRILDTIANHNFITESGELYSVTVSIGIASYKSTVKNSLDLYKFADKALYQAKESGKNAYIVYQNIDL